MSQQNPPVYRKLVNSMAFDPGALYDTAFRPWDLDEKYPPTVGELLLPPAEMQEREIDKNAEVTDEPAGTGGAVDAG